MASSIGGTLGFLIDGAAGLSFNCLIRTAGVD
jgi:hypothetical protein